MKEVPYLKPGDRVRVMQVNDCPMDRWNHIGKVTSFPDSNGRVSVQFEDIGLREKFPVSGLMKCPRANPKTSS